MPSLRSFIGLVAFSLVAITTSAHPSPTVTKRDGASFNPTGLPLRDIGLIRRAPTPLTNAKRLEYGYPLKKPRFNHAAKRVLEPRQSATPASACTPQEGLISVSYTSPDSITDGYISKVANSFGEYEFTSSADNALHVSICVTEGQPFDILTTNGISAYPYFGAVKGFASPSADLETSSFNYLYLAGISQTAPNSVPENAPNAFTAATGEQESIESAIWTIDSTSNVLTAEWINPDGSVPPNSIVYVLAADAFAVVGDDTEFMNEFGAVGVATLTFSPAAAPV